MQLLVCNYKFMIFYVYIPSVYSVNCFIRWPKSVTSNLISPRQFQLRFINFTFNFTTAISILSLQFFSTCQTTGIRCPEAIHRQIIVVMGCDSCHKECELEQLKIQSNLHKTVTLGKWPGDRYIQGDRCTQVSFKLP